MDPFAALLLTVVALPALLAAWSTAVGARRRGAPAVLAAVEAVCFPVTWAVWYVRDAG